jgi:uncharacterized protein
MRMRIHIRIMLPQPFDLLLVAVLALLGIPELLLMPVLKRALAAGSARARPMFYAIILLFEWLFTGAIIVMWIRFGRGWDSLFLGSITLRRFAVGLVLAIAAAWLWVHNRRIIEVATPERLEELRKRAAAWEYFLPHILTEYRLFQVVSITAGICEEIIYRGFVMWVAASYVGLPAAVALQAVIFGMGHVYQGNDLRSILHALLRTGLAGLLLAVIAIATGSLIPGMILHALMDLSTGDVAYRFFRKTEIAAAVNV